MKKIGLIISLIVSFLSSEGQVVYSISGVVKESSGETLPSATIFLDGSEKKTSTNDKGEFRLGGLSPGTYQLTVHFIGYKTWKQNVQIRDKSAVVDVKMETSERALKEVVITNTATASKYLQMFRQNFLGDTENGRSCMILNPKILNFSEQGVLVTAKTKSFLEIENRNLGYRIKYLIRDFRINRYSQIASYTGECIFESMNGSEEQMQEWEKNRRLAYHGSLMHYMRSLYSGSTDQEGFYAYFVKNAKKENPQIDTQKTGRQHLIASSDSTFLTIKFLEPLYLVYDTAKATTEIPNADEERIVKSINEKRGSFMELHLDKATIDAKGSIVDYRSFLIKGLWGTKRIGDQLPFEYVPH